MNRETVYGFTLGWTDSVPAQGPDTLVVGVFAGDWGALGEDQCVCVEDAGGFLVGHFDLLASEEVVDLDGLGSHCCSW